MSDIFFSVVVGNPPYQEGILNRVLQPSIYHYFYDLASKVSESYCLISPARFLFNAGNTPKDWNNKMLNDKHLKVVYYEQKSAEVFPNTDIKGGLSIIYRDEHKDFGKIGIFTAFKELKSILKKVNKIGLKSISESLSNTNGYRYTSKLYEDFPHYSNMEKGGGKNSVTTNTFDKFQEIYYDNKPSDPFEYIQIYGRQKNDRIYKWVRRDYINPSISLDRFKVFVPAANGSGAIGEILSTPLIGHPVIGHPVIGHTQTFISIGAFDNELEAENCLKYIKSKFARTMLGIKKVTQSNKTKETWSKVPLQDFTENSDINWTQSIPDIDRQLYKKYNLDENEINFIEEKVRAME